MKHPKFWNLIRAQDGGSAEVRVDGEIISDDWAWLYEWYEAAYTSPGSLRADLASLNGAPLTVWIDSPGGDVVAASAIYTALMEYKGPVTVKIDGACYSAASVIAMAGERIYMSPLATMMIHLAWTHDAGNAYALRHTADILEQADEALINAYEIKTSKPRAEIRALLEANDKQGTWMSAARAIELGFADAMLYAADSKEAQGAIVAHAQRMYAMLHAGTPPEPGTPEPKTEDWDTEAAQLTLERLRT